MSLFWGGGGGPYAYSGPEPVDLGGARLLLGEDLVVCLPAAAAPLLRITHTARPVSLHTAS